MISKFISLILFIPFIIIGGTAVCQTQTNLQIFNQLVDSSTYKILKSLPPETKEIKLALNIGDKYSVFYNRIAGNFKQKNIKLNNTNDSILSINYQLENTAVEYGEIFRDGFLGSFLMPRKNTIWGNYSVSDRDIMTNKFSYTYSDTVDAGDLEQLGTPGYTFTFGEPPEEPFFSSLLEPLAAVGIAAITVILFFTVRSK